MCPGNASDKIHRHMASGFPRLVKRFPASYDEFCRWRFQDTLLDELCVDYARVLEVLESQKLPSDGENSANNSRQELQALVRKLEHEFLERLANHAASECRT
jgi:hypothetical protein